MRAFWRRLELGRGGWAAEIGLRLGGLALLAICALLAMNLSAAPRQPGPVAFGAAMLCVFSGTLGCALLAEGALLFRRIRVPPRHARFGRRGNRMLDSERARAQKRRRERG